MWLESHSGSSSIKQVIVHRLRISWRRDDNYEWSRRSWDWVWVLTVAAPISLNHSTLLVWRWKHVFTRDVFSQVTELTLSAELPSYSTILELDRKVREKVLPPPLNLYLSSVQDNYTTPSAYIRGRILFQFRTTSEPPRRTTFGPIWRLYSDVVHSSQFFCTSLAWLSHKSSPQSLCSIIPCCIPLCLCNDQNYCP